MANDVVDLSEMTDTVAILRLWEESYQTPTYDPVPCLTRYFFSYHQQYSRFFTAGFCRLAELVEIEMEKYLKGDPDPFEDRNPSRSQHCTFGKTLKNISKKETFMIKV